MAIKGYWKREKDIVYDKGSLSSVMITCYMMAGIFQRMTADRLDYITACSISSSSSSSGGGAALTLLTTGLLQIVSSSVGDRASLAVYTAYYKYN